MKKITFIIAVAVHYSLFTIHSFSQPCLPEGIIFTTQAQIDSFQINYPNCTEIEGYVTIGDNERTNINNLYGLSALTSINGEFNIYWNPLLASLTGLDNIESLGGDLKIFACDSIASLTGLENLTIIYGSLSIGHIMYSGKSKSAYCIGNHSLTSIDGLENLSYIGENLSIINNDNLENLTGVENLNSIGGDLVIGELGHTGHNAYCCSNQRLKTLTGLNNLVSIGGSLKVYCSDSLTSLTALSTLISIGGEIDIGFGHADSDIFGNPLLVSIEGLDNIEAGSIENLYITDNYSLVECDVQPICSYLSSPNGSIIIQNNASGCNSQQEVEVACDTLSVKVIAFDNTFLISPNPCSNAINFRFVVSNQGLVTCDLIEISGVKVKSLMHEFKIPGIYDKDISLIGIPAGIYFCVLKTNEDMQARKLIKL